MLETVITYLMLGSLAIGVIRKYLMLNKLWIRRHEKAVVESISIVALLLSFATETPFSSSLVGFGASRCSK